MYDIYRNDNGDSWRYTLGKSGPGKLLVVGLNPSTATQEKSDNTVAKVERVANDNGYTGFVMLNLYPVRATDFRELPDEVDVAAYQANLKAIEAMVSQEEKPVLWAAWGESILEKKYFSDACLDLVRRLEKFQVQWLHFGEMTKTGHPRHPSRLDYSWSFSPLDVNAYAHQLRP